MLKQILIGQYIPGKSQLHRLDPRCKIIATGILMLLIFQAESLIDYILLSLVIVSSWYLSEVKLQHIYRGMRPILWLVYITFFLHIIINPDNYVFAFIISFRLFAFIYISTILTVTTSPLLLTAAIESLLAPLKKIIPVHEIALMLTISLRFIPTLIRETEKVIMAQTARGGLIINGTLRQKARQVIPLVVPLLIMSFKRAEELATAMEARCYQGSVGRTKYRVLEWTSADNYVVIILIVMLIINIFL